VGRAVRERDELTWRPFTVQVDGNELEDEVGNAARVVQELPQGDLRAGVHHFRHLLLERVVQVEPPFGGKLQHHRRDERLHVEPSSDCPWSSRRRPSPSSHAAFVTGESNRTGDTCLDDASKACSQIHRRYPVADAAA